MPKLRNDCKNIKLKNCKIVNIVKLSNCKFVKMVKLIKLEKM